jgi:hypothetical protein
LCGCIIVGGDGAYGREEEMVHMVVKVEKQLKWKGIIRQSQVRRVRTNTLEKRKTPQSLLKVTMLLLLLITMTINAFVV